MNEADYSYKQSVKSDFSDERINVYVIRPVAGLLVKHLYRTPVTPNHLTIAATVVGLGAACLYALNMTVTTMLAGLTITLKDLLDSADGQLARAKNTYSRAGRFLDSISDFIVNLTVFAAITWGLSATGGESIVYLYGILGFLGISLRVSYHVFYHTAYLHTRHNYDKNRLTEEIRSEDLTGDRVVLRLQSIYLVLYGWQDRLMLSLDGWCRRKKGLQEEAWYGDRLGLRLTGFLGMGTELLLLTVCSLAGDLLLYFQLNIVLMNGLWLCSVLYRRFVLAPKLSTTSS